MTKWLIRRSVFGWWVACDPDEPIGMIDTPTYYRAFTRERLLRKLERKNRPAKRPWETVQLTEQMGDGS